MALLNKLLKPTALIGPSLGPDQQLAIMKEDIEDTISNQLGVLEQMYNIMESEDQGATLAEIVDSKGFINFEFNGQQKVIYTADDEVYIATVTNSGLTAEHYLGTVNDDVLNWEFPISISDNTTADLDSVVSYMSNSLASTQILSQFVDAALYNEDGSDMVSIFSDTTSEFVGEQSSSLELRTSLIKAFNVLGSSKTAAVAVMTDIYTTLASLSINSDGELQFNNSHFYVQGFIGASFFKTAIEIGVTIVGTVLTAVNKVLGAIIYVAGSLLSWIGRLFEDASDSGVSFDYGSADYLFAMPIIQESIDKDVWLQSGNLPTLRQDLFDFISSHGNVCTITIPTGTFLLFYRPSNNSLNIEFYLNYLNEMNNGNPNDIVSTYWSYASTLTGTPADITWETLPTLSNGVRNYYNWYNMLGAWYGRSVSLDSILQQLQTHTGNWGSTAWMPEIYTNLALTTMWLWWYSGTVTSVHPAVDPDPGQQNWYDFPSSKEGLISYFSSYFSTITYGGYRVGWDWIVNYMIPMIRNNRWFLSSNDFWNAIDSMINENIDDTHQIWPILLDPSVDWKVKIQDTYGIDALDSPTTFIHGYYMNRRRLSMYPPKYSSGAVINTIAAIIGVAALATYATIKYTKFKRSIRSKMGKRYLDVGELQQTYLNDKTDENWSNYQKALKSYNVRASIFGYSKLSYISGWETGEDSTGVLGSSIQSVKDKTDSIIGSDDTSNLTDNSDLIRALGRRIG